MTPTMTQWTKILTANTTATSYAVDLTIKSLTDISASPWLAAQQFVALQFFGAGSDNNTAKARVLGAALDADGYHPVQLAAFSLTLSQAVGAASQVVLNTDRYADTITLDTGTGAGSMRVLSPTGDVPGMVVMDLTEFPFFCVDFITNGSATNVNGLYRHLRGGLGAPVIFV